MRAPSVANTRFPYVVFPAIFRAMGQDKRAKVKESFDRFDEDGNGKIDLIEYRKLLEEMGSGLGRAEAEAAFDSIDRDENGLIDFEEFFVWWNREHG